jgi:hypothetical protein
MCDAGWHDWFCKDESLFNRMKPMASIISKLKDGKIEIDTHYIFFKNNCPMNYPLYDSFSICDIETGDVKYFVAYKEKYDNDDSTWKVYDIREDCKVVFTSYKSKDIVNWFNNKEI